MGQRRRQRAQGLTAAAVALALSTGCAASAQQRAVQAGMVAREVVDAGADALGAHLRERAQSCSGIADRAAFDACLGPVASKPDAVRVALEGVRSAQVGLWLALASQEPGGMDNARAKLMAALAQLGALVRAAKAVK